RIVVAGSATDDNVGKTALAALSAANGQPEAGFGAGGVALAAIGTGGSSEAAGVAIAADGKILTGGSATQDAGGVATSQFAAARFLPTGVLDATFAPSSSTPGAALVTSPGLPAFGAALTPQTDGKLLVAGRVGDGDGETLSVARFCSADGQSCTGPGTNPGGLPGTVPNPADVVRPPFECGKIVAFGLIQAEGCLKAIDGGKFEASGRVNVNGIVMQPEAKSTIILDPTALRLYVDGPGSELGKLSARVGSITIFENLPFDLRLPSKTLESFALPNLKVSARGSVFGFPIGGSADLQLRKGAVELTVNVSLPKIFGGVTGTVVLRADLKDGFRPDGLKITAKEALLGPLKVKDVLITYLDSSKQWSGSATIFVVPIPYAASAEVSVENGALKKLVVGVEGINASVAPAIFLQRISFGVSVDPFTIQGGVGFSVGPKLGALHMVRIDGNFRLSFPGSPLARIEVAAGSFCQVSKCAPGAEDVGSGGLEVVGIPLGGFAFSADTDGQIAFSGNVGLDLAIVSLNAQVSGWVDGLKAFSVEGKGTACVFSVACVSAEGVISSEGLAACGSINLASVEVGVGFGIKWPTSLSVMGPSCDIGEYRATRASGARLGLPGGIGTRAQTGPQTVSFPAGKDYALVKLTGDTAPPEVTLAGGPTGAQITTPAAPSKGVKNADSMVFKDYEKKQTIFVVTEPGTQPWTITPQPGSSAITAVEQADPLPEPSVKAKVSGSGYRRTLTYSIKKIEGQTVRFAEVGGGVTHVLGEAKGTAGSIRFTPRDGAKGLRKIQATVVQGDLPRRSLTVAKYAAPGRRLPSRIRSASVSRGKTSATVRWSAASNLDTYRVVATISDGRTVMLSTPRKTRKVTIPDVTAQDSVKITVRGVTEALRTGPTTAAALKVPAKKTKKTKNK
ncbi:MAG: delta-60 repeat domain-containing protein, partial [Solirubrobacteraceae bacterium]|nr:delta-60 repeat domain-containing protein [Solirubrobacteraceae bacterium]